LRVAGEREPVDERSQGASITEGTAQAKRLAPDFEHLA